MFVCCTCFLFNVSHLSIVESLDVPKVGLPVEDGPALCPLIRLLVEQLLQVGYTGTRVQVDEAQIHLKKDSVTRFSTPVCFGNRKPYMDSL